VLYFERHWVYKRDKSLAGNSPMSEALRFERLKDWPGLIYRSQVLEIPGLSGPRPVSLWLPPDYFTSQQRWPLAIFFDGQNLFADTGSFAGGWQLHHVLTERAQAGLPVPVVVGVHHGPDRDAEMSPWSPYPGKTGLGPAKLNWIHTWLLPRLHQKLQVLPPPQPMLVGGSSLGGLLALYALFHHPEHYGQCLAMSPALWPDRFGIFNAIMLARPRAGARIYLDHGQKESPPGEEALGQILFEQTEVMSDLLEVLGFRRGETLLWHADPEGEHNEASWARRLPAALEFLYPPLSTPEKGNPT